MTQVQDKKTILKVLVGSHAHGLADKNSDKDYRAVYVLPTSKILSIGFKYRGTDWCEGAEDNTAYEIGHFLQLATKCNPTILEVFKAPVVEMNEDGEYLRKMMSWCWSPEQAFNAFVGYGLNQRKKFLDKKDNRQDKYACTYIRTLITCEQLLRTENFDVEVPQKYKSMLKRFRRGAYTVGEVIDVAEDWAAMCRHRLAHCKHQNDLTSVNHFLVDIRKKYWTCGFNGIGHLSYQ